MKLNTALAIVAVVFGLFGASAATNEYTGGKNGSWFTASNWSLSSVPTDADDVLIPAGKSVKATTGAIAAQSLTISGSGASLTLGAGSLAPQTIAEIVDDLTVTAGGTLDVYAGALTDLSVFNDAITNQTVAIAAI